MVRKIMLSVMSAAALFLVGYGVLLASEKNEPQEQQETASAQESDETLGSLDEAVADGEEEEFPILERDLEKYEELMAAREPEVTPLTPVSLTIPSLEIEAPVIQVGMLENGEMEVPEDVNEVGWFEPGVMPGARGNSVLAGHVDSYRGPAVFFKLKDLKQGDEIIVTGENGETLTFAVTDIQTYPSDGAPIERIFGPSGERNLNLITCTGPFNRDSGQYPDRLVVYTQLVEEEPVEIDYEPSVPENVELTGNLLKWYAVRDKEVVGYRIYQKQEDGTFDYIDSVSYFERKSLVIEDEQGVYAVSSVAIDGKESAKAILPPQ
ncbi:class F sortase [Jeotgalibacillus sp. R-1-5s-1]|uniref:class F sortase n=1 Tax=Jeotgalibacillus sp. R-1-5s-1 TaxID=2555897 RepID=UPI00106A87D2|nr:class F sortase [Jeotgalibacillus sp. R-1-5s-1]TFD95878.1 class F sortase [Jeotgalibacillus sp. R-1-5s-1]